MANCCTITGRINAKNSILLELERLIKEDTCKNSDYLIRWCCGGYELEINEDEMYITADLKWSSDTLMDFLIEYQRKHRDLDGVSINYMESSMGLCGEWAMSDDCCVEQQKECIQHEEECVEDEDGDRDCCCEPRFGKTTGMAAYWFDEKYIRGYYNNKTHIMLKLLRAHYASEPILVLNDIVELSKERIDNLLLLQ